MSATTQEQVLSIITARASADAPPITPQSTLQDLGIPSLDAIEIIFDIEEKFDITLSNDDADVQKDNIQGLVDAVQRAIDAKATGA